MRETFTPKNLLQTARRIQGELDSAGTGRLPAVAKVAPREWLDRFDEIVTFDPLRAASRNLFANAHYARSVEEAFKCLNNAVKEKSGLLDLDGAALMRQAFSANNPILRLNSLKTRSEKDEQQGYMDLYAGAMTGVRNPRGHEHTLEDEPVAALEMLTFANHLMRKLESASRGRRRSKRASKIP